MTLRGENTFSGCSSWREKGVSDIALILTNVVQSIQDYIDCEGNFSAAEKLQATIKGPQTILFGENDLVAVVGDQESDVKALTYNFALQIAVNQRLPVYIFSNGGSKLRIGLQMLCLQGQLPCQRTAIGHLSDDEWNRMNSALGALCEVLLFIDGSKALTVDKVFSFIRKELAVLDRIGLVVVEAIDCVGRSEGEKSPSMLSVEMMLQFKSLALEMGTPIIVTLSPARRKEKACVMLKEFNDSEKVLNDVCDITIPIHRKKVLSGAS